ncbi:hypothetical protein IWQ62_006049 [Dispira parvispora]|uniref:Uncharacterized protein n=1 Tax=Dispira parvispora TaxID=1520584 RepID=A0A9W8AJ73_9FUNG|nr:hypothetical protein IWQ62_006049 [Dispira parvispora]
MSPLMDSMYVLNEGSNPTYEPSSPTSLRRGTSTTKSLTLGQPSPLSQKENQSPLPTTSQTVKLYGHHQQKPMPQPISSSPYCPPSAVPQDLTDSGAPDQKIVTTSSPTYHTNTAIPNWQASVAQYPSPTPSHQFPTLGKYTQSPSQEPSSVQVDMSALNPPSESEKPPTPPKSRRRKRLTYCCCTIF